MRGERRHSSHTVGPDVWGDGDGTGGRLTKKPEEVQMTDQEKIAKWAGFTECPQGGWWSPDADWSKDSPHWLPDTTDLTWLFKWCVPKLLHKDVCINAWSGSPGYEAIIHKIACEPIIKIASTPGEALRDAIRALIGEGK